MRTSTRAAAALLTAALASCVFMSQAQNVHHGESFGLGSTLEPTESHEYYANDYIDLKTGFHSEPKNHNHTFLELDSLGYGIYPPEEGLVDDWGCVVGTLGGTVDIGAMGGLIYTIPLELPAGINGMQPRLSITYNSQAGNGLMGWGWNLTGLSSITRTGKTIYHDGEMSAVELSLGGPYLLDGKRLIRVADYTDSIEYRLEQDEMAKIMAYMRYDQGGLFGYGTIKVLDHFVVWKADGLVMEYGATSDSWIEPQQGEHQAVCWLLDKVTDRNGNSIVYHYDENQAYGTHPVDLIEYTVNEAHNVQAQFSVRFDYSRSRLDYEQYFINGNQIIIQHLLEGISVFKKQDSKPLYKYELSYDMPGNYHYKRLRRVGMEAYDFNGKMETVNPTTINWNSSLPSTFTPHQIANPEIFDDFPFLGDFDGDGYTDVAMVPYKDSSVYDRPVSVRVYLNNRNGGFEHNATMDIDNVPPTLDWIHVLDVNGDGLDDLALVHYDTIPSYGIEATSVFVYRNNANTHAFDSIGGKFVFGKGDVIVGDFNGDCISDVVLFKKKYKNVTYSKDSNSSKLMPFIEDAFYLGFMGNQFRSGQLNTSTLEGLGPVYNTISADFDGDGISEVLLVGINESGSDYHGSKICRFDFGDGADCLKVAMDLGGSGPYQPINHRCHVFPGDFNGDGKVDLIYNIYGDWQLAFSRGGSFGPSHDLAGSYLPDLDQYYVLFYPSLRALQKPGPNQYVVSIAVYDFNGDGCSDIGFTLMNESKLYVESRPTIETSGHISFRNRIISGSGITFRSQFIHVGNYLGRDNVSFLGKKDQNAVRIYSIPSVPQYNSVTSVIDGMGNRTSFTYDCLSPKATGTPAPFYSYSYAAPDVHGVRRVPLCVRALKTCSVEGVNGSRLITKYQYQNAMCHRYGHGFMGFSASIVETYHNSTDSLWTTRKVCFNERTTMGRYAMMLPYRELSYIHSDGEARAVNKTQYTFANARLASGLTDLVVCPAMTGKTEEIYSMDEDDELIATIATSYQYDYDSNNHTYNNAYGCTSSTQTVTEYDSGSAVAELQTVKRIGLQTIGSTWIVNRPVSDTVTRTRNSESVSTCTSFTYSSNNTYQPQTVTVLPNAGTQPNDPLTVTTSYGYDAFGNVTETTVSAPYGTQGEMPRTISYEYGTSYQHRLPTKETKGLATDGYVTEYGYDFHDRLALTTDCNGKRTSHATSILGNDQNVFMPDGTMLRSLTLWADQSAYKPENACYYTWSKKTGGVTAMTFYHKSGLELRTVTFDFEGHPVFSDKRYNAKGLLEKESAPYRMGEPEGNLQWTVYHYDAYDRMDRIGYPDGSVRTIAYNGLETTTTVTPPQGSPVMTPQTTVKRTNALGWLCESADANGTSVFYEYYADGNLKWTRVGNDEATKISMEYDHAGNRIRLHDPDYCTATKDLISVYNAFGEEVSRTTPKELESVFTYDRFGRMTERVEDEIAESGVTEQRTTLWNYSETVPQKGLLLSVAYPGQTVTYTYDTCQRVTDEAVRFSAEEAYVTRYTYDGASRIASVVYPSGFTVNHRYNARGYQSAQTDYGGDELYRTKGTSPMGQPERFVLGGVLLNTLEYDPERHLLTMTRTTKNNTSLQNLSFDYDGFCNLASRRDNMRNLEETFTYDSQNRLTGVWLGASQTGSSAYDGYGRMTAKTAGGQPVFSNAVYNTTAKPHAITSAQTTAGLFPSDAQSITYTGFDKVGKVKQGNDSLCYTYGYDRQRILMEEHVGGLTRTKRYVGNCEFVTESDGTTTAEYCLTYLTGPTGVYSVVVKGSDGDAVHYILKDNLGSWTTITNANGTVEQRLSFDAWGNLRDPNTWSGSFTGAPMFDRGFTGHEHLYNFGLINMNGRMYDPVMSVFLSVDQCVQSSENAQGFNRYAYCMNNPLRYVDPSGWLAGGGNTGYFPNSTANAFDPYMFYGHTALEPRDLGIRELSTADPIITWMEENSLHASGNGAKDNCDLPIIDPSNLTSSQKESLDNILSFAQKNSDLFNKLFSCLFDSKTVYSLIIGPTSNNVPAQYNPEDNTIVFRDEESLIVIKAIVEEFFHAYQLSENKSLYGSEEFNYEFEAKVAVFLIVEQLIGLHENANGTNFERMYSFIAPNGIDVIMPTTQSIQETPFLKDYYEAAEFFRKWNIDNHYGNINYRARTAQTPKSLFELFKP